jgi:puromycin-sensitive aminopeptidase
VLPSHYSIHLAPDLESATFTGRLSVDVDVRSATNTIVLNAIELTITKATVIAEGAEQVAAVALDERLERATLTLTDAVDEGPAVVDIEFIGILNDKLRGFYRSTFVDQTGQTRTIATTQFESTNARRAFPCWDEPDIKATFGVTLTHDTDLMAISSGPEIATVSLPGGRTTTTFGTTMVMSTYLLAFVIGPLEATEPVDVAGTPLRVVHPLGKGHLAGFALEAGAFALRHFTDYFAIGYPGEKLDLVALPDFAFGAMENLGCVTFREALLILDEDVTTQPEQQRAADVINHEIAHMWFGDLVTMKWWNGIWLKEAFATFCEMHATNAWKPEWKRWDDFGLSRTDAFDTDSLSATRPIEYEVVSPDDAEAMYDVLTYEKGAAVVRMLEQYLGEEPFRDGIRAYLAQHAYGNTETTDLWDALESSTGQPARQIMDSWIFQGGYPLIDIELETPSAVKLSQRRFGYGDVDPRRWSVPVVLVFGSAGTRNRLPVLLDGESVTVDLGTEPDWVVANADASGFYRVRPSMDLAARLQANLQQLSAVERYGLIDDAWALVLADQVDPQRSLDLAMVAADTETDLAVWRRIVGVVRSIDRHLTGDAQAIHRARSLTMFNAALDRLGRLPALGESDHHTERRAVLFGAAGTIGDPEAIALARELIDAPQDAARTAAAIRVIATNGNADDFAAFVDRYDKADTPQEQRRFMFALAAFPGETETAKLLDLIEAGRVRSQDGAHVLAQALANNDASAVVWDYIASNWDAITERYPDNAIPRMLEGCQAVADPDVAGRIDRFFETHTVPQAGQTLFQHLERMRVTVNLRRRLRA